MLLNITIFKYSRNIIKFNENESNILYISILILSKTIYQKSNNISKTCYIDMYVKCNEKL